MAKQKVYQLNSELFKVTGIQRVLLDIHEALKDDFDAKIVGTIPYDKVDKTLGIDERDYMKMSSPFKFRNSVVIIHERRFLPFMWILTHIPGLNVKCVYVHHNELWGNKLLSLFPKNVIAISDAGIRNLTEYFGVPHKNITKIHNCVRESSEYTPRQKSFDPDNIKILYPARINSVKRQLAIVNHLKGKLDSRIKILFAGTGPQFEEFKSACKGNDQFQVLGFRNDIPSLMNDCDFVMLFSQHEGLPISLIEAAKSGVPVICNNVGGNTEIIDNRVNGFVVDEWEELITCLNKLPELTQMEIDKMSKAGRDIYMNRFNFKIFKNNYLKLIKNIK